jgi:hypothetical protein
VAGRRRRRMRRRKARTTRESRSRGKRGPTSTMLDVHPHALLAKFLCPALNLMYWCIDVLMYWCIDVLMY